jgi:alpha-beta hydrolase superfamily lysophospholipase
MARVGGVSLCYETFGSADSPPLLLVMGLSAQMVLWDEEFCERLAAEGFWVIRFDNRDVGRSTILREAGVPKQWQLLVRDQRAATGGWNSLCPGSPCGCCAGFHATARDT